MVTRALMLGLVAGFGVSAAAQPDVPERSGRVVDLAYMLSAPVEAAITDRLDAYQDSTGIQMAVLIIPSLEGAVLETYATEVFRAWELNDAERDDGVLLLIARGDHEVRIEVGYDLEGSIPDVLAARIIRTEMTPRFRENDADGAALAAVEALIAVAEGRPPRTSPRGDHVPWPVAFLMGILFGVLPAVKGGSFAMVSGIVQRYVVMLFVWPFVFIGSAFTLLGLESIGEAHPVALFMTYPVGGVVIALGLGYPVSFILVDMILSRSSRWQEKRRHHRAKREAFHTASLDGLASFVVDGRSYAVPPGSSGGGGGLSRRGESWGGGGASGEW